MGESLMEIDIMKDILDDIDVWKKREEEFFQTVKCYLVEYKGIKYHAICPKEDLIKNDLFFIPAIGEIKKFLNNKNKILVPSGFWTCRCKTEFIHSPYSSFCPLCQCNIQDNTNRALYFNNLQK